MALCGPDGDDPRGTAVALPAGLAAGPHAPWDPGPIARMPPIRDINEHPDPFVTPDELATYLKVSLDTIHRAIRRGALAAVRVGPRLLRIRTEDARRFLRP